jgi:lysozyme
MKISQNGLNLLKQWESLRLSAYRDSKGVPTIGYGTTRYPNGNPVKMGDKITEEQAFDYLDNDLALEFEPAVDKIANVVPLTQNQYDALVIFCYNIGASRFRNSTAAKEAVKDPNSPNVGAAMKMWNKITNPATGQLEVLEGLVNRRNKEVTLYYSK